MMVLDSHPGLILVDVGLAIVDVGLAIVDVELAVVDVGLAVVDDGLAVVDVGLAVEMLCSSSQVEKTRHFLLLRAKLESTLLLGLEPLASISEEEVEEVAPPKPPQTDRDLDSPSMDLHSERQRELAAKVSLT